MISPVTVVTEAYSCAYVGNLCPRLDMVLRLGWLASMFLLGTEGYTSGFCSGAGFCIGDLWVSYSSTGTDSSYSGSAEFSLVAQP